jgi:hypothetical protein
MKESPRAGRLVDQLFPGNGEMAALMRSADWARTQFGPVETWPKSLRTVAGVLLGSRFPMMVWWGPNLLNPYNDAYRQYCSTYLSSFKVQMSELRRIARF